MEDAVPAVRSLRERLAGDGGTRPDYVHDAVDFLSGSEPEYDWVIPGLVERQGRILLTGVEGGGKSMLALTLAVQAATGCAVLDRFGIEIPARVAYFDLEMGRRSTFRRLHGLAQQARHAGRPLDRRALDVVHRPDGIDLNNKAERDRLLRFLVAEEPDLIVFDPLYKMAQTDAVYERDIRPLIRFLDQIRVELGSALVLVHHLRKRSGGEQSRGRDSSDVFGSSVLLRWPETVAMLGSNSLKITKDRDGIFGDQNVFPVVRGGRWYVSLLAPTSMLEDAIFEEVAVKGPISATTIAKNLERRKQDVLTELKRLEGIGRVVRDGDGSSTKWEVPDHA